MRSALELAAAAAGSGEVPVGAVITHGERIIGSAGNGRERLADPTAHAEVLAIRAAAAELGGWRLDETSLYVTLEPCAMCAGAIILARIPRVVFATPDPKAGAAGSVLDLLADPRLNHRPQVAGGLLAEEAAAQLREFFQARR
jgi:tRNA(adenine34) deaminase